jgi:hypothetical protein
MAARITGVGVTAQGGGATDLEGAQNPQLGAAQRAGVALPVDTVFSVKPFYAASIGCRVPPCSVRSRTRRAVGARACGPP